jgi:hypothetical protein
MKSRLLAGFLFFGGISFAQVVPQTWLSGAVSRKLTSKLTSAASLDLRFYDFSAPGTIFPQLSLSYKIIDGVKLSADYRMLFKENLYRNYVLDNRLNFNIELKTKFKYVDAGFRFRYQSTFGTLQTVGNYAAEFDQAIRLKPSLVFHFNKKSKFTPAISGEWFYSLANKELGKRFTKYRLAAGTSYNLKGPKSLDVKYIYGQSINLPKKEAEHILSLTYNYDWEKLTAEQKTKKAKERAKRKLKRHPELEAEE